MITEQEVKEKTIERFWSKIDFKSIDDCWEWTGAVFCGNGYGQWGIPVNGKWKNKKAHRYLYEELNGTLNKLLLVCHKCDNPKCVNPNHFFIGTSKDNANDRDMKGRNGDVRGTKNAMAKLKEDQVIEIRFKLNNGLKLKEIAREYDVCFQLISLIKHRKVWATI